MPACESAPPQYEPDPWGTDNNTPVAEEKMHESACRALGPPTYCDKNKMVPCRDYDPEEHIDRVSPQKYLATCKCLHHHPHKVTSSLMAFWWKAQTDSLVLETLTLAT